MIHLQHDDTLSLMHLRSDTPPAIRVQPGELIEAEVENWLAGHEDATRLPPPFTPESLETPLGPITGPIYVESAAPGDMLVADIEEIQAHEPLRTAVLRQSGYLASDFPAPFLVCSSLDQGYATFGERIHLPIRPSLGAISTMPSDSDDCGRAGPHGGNMNQNEVRAGTRVYLPVFVPGGLLFLADPHALVGDGMVCGSGLECRAVVRLRVTVERELRLSRPLIETANAVMTIGTATDTNDAIRDAARAMIAYLHRRHGLPAEEAYTLISIVGDVRLGTAPSSVMAARVQLPKVVLEQL